jgi:3-oxoacyl-[acyl-carrier protein] reductase
MLPGIKHLILMASPSNLALPVGRFGRPEEIAATGLLLAGPDGGFYVGATLSPNGGDVMY